MEDVDYSELLEWVERWGEDSYDDLSPDMAPMEVANRIVEFNVDDVGDVPQDAYERLAGMVAPALARLDGWMPSGASWLAQRVLLGAQDADYDEEEAAAVGRSAGLGEGGRVPFGVLADARARDLDEPALDDVIEAAARDYLSSGMTGHGFDPAVKGRWLDAAAFAWSKLMADMEALPVGERCSDSDRLATLSVAFRFAPDSTRLMVAEDLLDGNGPLSLAALRALARTPPGGVDADRAFARLVDGADAPDLDRLDRAAGVLEPLEDNAPTSVCYRICGLRAMLDLAAGRTGEARRRADLAIGYDAADRFASCVLDRIPDADAGLGGAMDLSRPQGPVR